MTYIAKLFGGWIITPIMVIVNLVVLTLFILWTISLATSLLGFLIPFMIVLAP